VFTRYTERILIENELDAYIGGFHLDGLTSGLPLNVDLDTTLTVLAGNCYGLLAHTLPHCEHATRDLIWRHFLDTTGVAWSLQPTPPRPWQCSLPSPPLPSTRTLAGLRPSHVDAHQVSAQHRPRTQVLVPRRVGERRYDRLYDLAGRSRSPGCGARS
jgi:hypothetical protein